MKQFLRICFPVLTLITLLPSSSFAQGRLATVDLRKVFDTYWKTKQASATLKERAADLEKEHKNMLDDWKKTKEEYQALIADTNNKALSSDERDKRKKSAEDKFKSIQETESAILSYEKQARETLDQQQRRMRENILSEIRTVLSAKAKTSGFNLVIDSAAESVHNTPIVLFTTNENDLTDIVLAQLNATSPQEPRPDEKKPDKKK